MSVCTICGSSDVTSFEELGHHFNSCGRCGHLWHTSLKKRVDYTSMAIALPYTPERATSQLAFIAPALREDMSVFELGCGPGTLCEALHLLMPNVRYDAVEVSPHGAQARQVMNHLWSRFEDVEPPEGGYGLVIVSHVLEHVDTVHDVLFHLRKLMAERGKLFIEVPNGSGHNRIPLDTNPGHLHSFSLNSLAELLSSQGLKIAQCVSGAYESARYPDSLRVLAEPIHKPEMKGDELSKHLKLEDPIVIWGAGGMARELLVPYFDTKRIHCYVDKNSELWGTELGGVPICGPDKLTEMSGVTLIISSIDHEAAIRRDVAQDFPKQIKRILSMRAILGK